MALCYPTLPCAVCGQPIGTDESNILGFNCIDIPERDFQHFADGLAHISCLSSWDRRDEFMEAWNRALGEYYAGKRLYRGADGRVTYTDSATWVIQRSPAVQRRQAEKWAQLNAELRRRKEDLASRMQAERDKAVHLGIASEDDVDGVLHDLSAEEFRLHFGEFRVSRAFFKGAA